MDAQSTNCSLDLGLQTAAANIQYMYAYSKHLCIQHAGHMCMHACIMHTLILMYFTMQSRAGLSNHRSSPFGARLPHSELENAGTDLQSGRLSPVSLSQSTRLPDGVVE